MIKPGQMAKPVEQYHDLSSLFFQFVEKYDHPFIIIKYSNIDKAGIIYSNPSFNATFKQHLPPDKDFFNFIKKFSFQTEPVNILASKEILIALWKKTGDIFNIKTQPFDNETVSVEFIKESVSLMHNQPKPTGEYYKFADLLPEIVFELNHHFNLTYLNSKALKTFGYQPNDLEPGIHLSDIMLKKDFHKIKSYLYSIFEGHLVKEKAIAVVDAIGDIRILEVFFTLVKQGVKVTGIRGIGIDITHRKKVEERLIRARTQIEEADRLKTSFLMNMSHEIRTPLNSVLGYAQLLQRKIKEPVLQSYLQSIRSSGKGLLQLFNDLIDLSKIYAGQLDIIPVETNLNKLIDKLYKEFTLEIEVKNKPIDLKVIKALENNKADVYIDDDRLKQIIISLFNNSLKFTKTGFIEFGYQMADKNIHFFIKDSGIGIDKKIQKQVFEFFYQPVNIAIEQNRGTGIGLAITKGIIDKMNGKIWIESDVGKGTLFNFLLPYEPVGIKLPGNKRKNIISLQNTNILVVEDDEDNLFLLNSFLENTGAHVKFTKNGNSAVEKATHEKFDVIFMDINIPGVNGIDATKKIRKFDKDVIIIAQSAYVTKEDKLKCYTAGCDAFIEKPIYGEELLTTLSGFLTRKN